MAEKSTIARPYAQAAFDLARDSKDLKNWSEMLQFVAAVCNDARMATLILNPQIQKQNLINVLLKICGDRLNKLTENFIRVLAANNRLNVLSEIVVLFEQHRADEEGTLEAEVISAYEMSQQQQLKLVDALNKRLGRKVTLVTKTDESLVGGTIVRAGDLVIDGSVTGQLEKLAHVLIP